MENADPHRKNIDKLVRKKQERAEKMAARLRERAGLLRKFAEKYRDNSAAQLYGRNIEAEED